MKAVVMTADFASLIWIERKTMDFVKDLKSEDKEIFDAIAAEFDRQQNQIELNAPKSCLMPVLSMYSRIPAVRRTPAFMWRC